MDNELNKSQRYYRKNRERYLLLNKNNRLKRLYGISLDDFERMVVEQDGKCAICGSVEPLCVDHDHSSGQIRGLLCGRCNKGLGLLGDSLEGLLKAVEYLG